MVDKPLDNKASGPTGRGTGTPPASRPPYDAAERSALARNLFAQLKATPPGGGAAAPTAAPNTPLASVGGIRVVGPAAQAAAAQRPTAAANRGPAPAVQNWAATAAARAANAAPPKTAKKPAPRRPRFRLRVRLLPITIFLLVLMLGVRLGDSWRVLTHGGGLPEVSTLQAQTPPPPTNKDTPKEPGKEPAKGPEKEPAKGTEDAPSGRPKIETVDLELVQHLSQRREELDQRSKALDQREALMVAAEKRLDQKLAELQSVRANIQELLKQVDDKQKAQLESLVRIYETMKPKDAARIFEQLEPEVLLGVVERMKEAKTAPILAAMDAIKARDLTTRLAEQRRLPTVPQ